jgi:UDPglucose--hexose-1-phosphate uridylyltransferase
VESEKNSGRKCFENADFVAFTPYASRFNYEVWIFPKQHVSRLENVNFSSLAVIVSKVLGKVHDGNLDYNMLVQYGPKGQDFHFHIEVCPRAAIWAGFELGSGIIINSVAPEDAAKFYRGEE